jgi:hypothetical protein
MWEMIGKFGKMAGKVLEPLAIADMASEGVALGRNWRERMEQDGVIKGNTKASLDTAKHVGAGLESFLNLNNDFYKGVTGGLVGYEKPLNNFSDPIQPHFQSQSMSDSVANYPKEFINNAQYMLTGQANVFDENEQPTVNMQSDVNDVVTPPNSTSTTPPVTNAMSPPLTTTLIPMIKNHGAINPINVGSVIQTKGLKQKGGF